MSFSQYLDLRVTVVHLVLCVTIRCYCATDEGSVVERQPERRVVCLTDETSNEVFLQCPDSSVISLISAIQGKQDGGAGDSGVMSALTQEGDVTEESTNATDTNMQCEYIDNPECAIQIVEYSDMLNSCMGQEQCNVLVNKTMIGPCGQQGNYVQVEYHCVASVDIGDNVDICGDSLDGRTVHQSSGRIETPGYPDNYSPGLSCSCNLTAQLGNQIVLTLLDIDLEPDDSECYGDWLSYHLPGQGHGDSPSRVCQMGDSPNRTDVFGSKVSVVFNANGEIEGRGFWMEYKGRTSEGAPAAVSMVCGDYIPSLQQDVETCLLPDQEAATSTLDCGQRGRINILRLVHGATPPGCDLSQQAYCEVFYEGPNDYLRLEPLRAECQGRGRCVVQVDRNDLGSCGSQHQSNYHRVVYECVPDAHDKHNIIDVSGLTTQEVLARRSGYITSPNYPDSYPANDESVCELHSEPDTHIHLKILDMSLGSTDCSTDWLEYSTPPDHERGQGVKLCGQHPIIEQDTTARHVYLYFSSDHVEHDRGFWIQYTGLRNGQPSPITVQCRPYHNTSSDDGGAGSDKSTVRTVIIEPVNKDDDNDRSLAIILSMTLIILTIVVVMVAVFAYKGRRSKNKAKEAAKSAPPTISNPGLDRRYMTLNSFSPLAVSSPYASMGNGKHGGGQKDARSKRQMLNEYVENHPDYDPGAIAPAGGAGGHMGRAGGHMGRGPDYVNPAYSKSWEAYNSRL